MTLRRTLMSFLVLIACANASAECTNIIYVDAAATGAANGTSWTDAYNTLQDALFNPGQADCVWVASAAEHHYTPDQGPGITSGDRSATFQLLENVAIYGGFRGTAHPSGGETTATERDPATNVTILSGEIGAPDTGDNSYHVVTGSGVGPTAVLDGFTITAGNADGIPPRNTGGGMFNEGGSPTVINCVFADNEGTKGAGMHNLAGSDPLVINCIFRRNAALGGGGILDIDSSPTIMNCIFAGNSACTGGAVANLDSSAVITSNPTIVNSTFIENTAYVGGEGGGMWNLDSAPTVSNCIFWSNTGGEIIDYSGAGTTVTYSDVEGGWTGSGSNNLNEDPLFVDAAGPDEQYGTEDDDLHLLSGSPCLDAGDNVAVPLDDADLDNDGDTGEPVPVDLDGARRFIDDPSSPDTGNGTPPIVDMGPYEFCPSVDPPIAPDSETEPGFAKNRYLSFVPTNAGVQTALRITLQEGNDPVLVWWVGEPQEVSENAGIVNPAQAPGWPTFWAAQLVYDPDRLEVEDWPTAIGSGVALHVYGCGIVPGKTYEVQTIHENCVPGVERNFSAPLPVTMSLWGDIVGRKVGDLWTAPDGVVDITYDVTAMLDKFRNLDDAPIKARCDIEPELVDQLVNIGDVTMVLDAFRGIPYPFREPQACEEGGGGGEPPPSGD